MSAFTRETLRHYFTGTYTAPNLIVSAVGNTEHAQVLDLVVESLPGDSGRRYPRRGNLPQVVRA